MKNVYQLRVTKRKKPRGISDIPKPDKNIDEVTMGLIQGKEPGSRPEWIFSQGLDYWKVQYIYQYSVLGYPFSGGQKIDFWCFTPILPTPVFIQGLYWHGGQRLEETKYKVWNLTDQYRGKIFDPVEVWDYEIPTIDAAIQIVHARLRI